MDTRIGHSIAEAAALLQQDQLVAIPTETVYGLAGNALSEKAVAAIFAAKERPRFNPLILHLPSWESVRQYVTEIPEAAQELARKLSPGPITFLLPKKEMVSDLVTAGSERVAIRIPAHPLTHELLTTLSFPLVAPSANTFGYVSPTTAQHVLEGLNGRIPYILDGGPCGVGVESTIVGFSESGLPEIYRQGGISMETIESCLKMPVLDVTRKTGAHLDAPGRLKSHYAPHTPLYAGNLEALVARFQGRRVAIIAFRKKVSGIPDSLQFILSESGDVQEAATRLFAALRKADQAGVEMVLAELLPEQGIARAINDRLRRADIQWK